MANQLTMAAINAILTLHKSGHSRRAIARMLGVHRDTVARHLAQNRPNAPTGSETVSQATDATEAGGNPGPARDAPVESGGSQARLAPDTATVMHSTKSRPGAGAGPAVGKSGPASGCAAFRDVIVVHPVEACA